MCGSRCLSVQMWPNDNGRIHHETVSDHLRVLRLYEVFFDLSSSRECVDLVDGQTTLLALVKSRGIKVHGNLGSAIQTTADFLKSSSLNNGMTAEELITYKLRYLGGKIVLGVVLKHLFVVQEIEASFRPSRHQRYR